MFSFPGVPVMEGVDTCNGDTWCSNGAQGLLCVPQQVAHELK